MSKDVTFTIGYVPASKMFLLYKEIMHEGSKIFQDCSLFEILGNLIPLTALLNSWLADIVQKCFCTPDGALNSTFQKKYVPPF